MPNAPDPNPHLEFYNIFATQIAYARDLLQGCYGKRRTSVAVVWLFNQNRVPYVGPTNYTRFLELYLTDHHPDLMLTKNKKRIVYREEPAGADTDGCHTLR